MALIWADKTAETSTTTGTGNFTLAGALTGYRTFASVCATSDTFYYSITAVDGNGIPTGDWETGLGTYSAANTLTRTTVHASSNAGSAVNFAAGTKRVTITATASVHSKFIRALGGFGWTDLTFGSSSSAYGATVYTATETFALAAGKTVEVELLLYKLETTGAALYIGDLTNAMFTSIQTDDNLVQYRRNGGADTLIGTASGSFSENNFTGVHRVNMMVMKQAASTLNTRSNVNGLKLPANNSHVSAAVTAFDLSTVNISIITDDIAKCFGRARVIG